MILFAREHHAADGFPLHLGAAGRFASIDPGKDGGVVLWERSKPVRAVALASLDVVELAAWFEGAKAPVLVVEAQWSASRSPAAALRLSFTIGLWLGALRHALGTAPHVVWVAPSTWQADVLRLVHANREELAAAQAEHFGPRLDALGWHGTLAARSGVEAALAIGHWWTEATSFGSEINQRLDARRKTREAVRARQKAKKQKGK